MIVKEDNSIFNSMGSVGSNEEAKSSKAPKSKYGTYLGDTPERYDEEPEQMVSDGQSVQSTFMDRISSIFTLRGNAQPSTPVA